MFIYPANRGGGSEYALGIGWVLMPWQDCEICGDRAVDRTKPHPVDCPADWRDLPQYRAVMD